MDESLKNLSRMELLRRCEALQAQVDQLRPAEKPSKPDDYHAAIVREDCRYRVLFEEAADGICILDSQGKIIAVNNAFAQIHGYTSEKLKQMSLADLDTPESAVHAPERIKRVLAGEALTFEVEHYHKDDHIITLEVKVSVIEFGDERLIVAFHRDITEEMRARKALEASERRYRLLADHVADLIWTMDAKHNFTYLSPSVERFLGYTPEECLNLDFSQVFPPDSLAIIQKRIASRREAWARGDYEFPARAMELEHIRKDGKSVWAEVLVNPIFGDDGRPIGLVGVTRDISIRRAIQKSLQASEKRIRDITDSIPGIVFLLRMDNEGQFYFDYMSKGVEDYLPYSSAEICEDATRLFDQMLPEDRAEYGAAMRHSAETLKPLRHDFRIRRKNGQIIWWENNAVPQQIETGEILWTAIGMDVTYLKHTEEALRESVSEQQAIFDGAMVGIMLLRNRVIEKVNERLADMLGYDSLEMLGQNTEFLHMTKDKYLSFGRKYYPQLRDGHVLQVDYELRHRDGHALQCLVSGKSIDPVDPEGGAVWIVEDITALREEENHRLELERLVQTSRRHESLANMASAVAHNFNNSLQVVLGNLSFAEELTENEGDTRTRRFLSETRRAAEKAAELSRLMLLYVGQDEERPRIFSMEEFLEGRGGALKAIAQTSDSAVSINIEYESGGWFGVQGREDRIWEMLVQLVENAVEAVANRKNGRIIVRLSGAAFDTESLSISRTFEKPQAGHFVVLEVEDNGCGMDAKESEQIFEPYFSTKFIGRGLGLSAVLGIVRLHNGAIFVETEKSQGTKIRVLVPSAE